MEIVIAIAAFIVGVVFTLTLISIQNRIQDDMEEEWNRHSEQSNQHDEE